jgi:hypothetical protein
MITKNIPLIFASSAAVIIVLIGGFSVQAGAKEMVRISLKKAFTFARPANPPGGKVGTTYAAYSFCMPAAATGFFCGKVLPKNGETANPTGGTPNYTFSSGVGLPPGLRLNLNGTLSGKPTKAGTYTFKICAKDRVGKQKCYTGIRVVIDKKDEEKKPDKGIAHPQAAIEITPNQANLMTAMGLIDTVSQDQFNASFGKAVRDFSIDAGGMLASRPRQGAQQKHWCFETKNCGGACGLCFGPEWTLTNPIGEEVRLSLYGLVYDPASDKTTFKLGVMSGDPTGFRHASVKSTTVLPGGGLSAVIHLDYMDISDKGTFVKDMPDFTITISGTHPISREEAQQLQQDGTLETISF